MAPKTKTHNSSSQIIIIVKRITSMHRIKFKYEKGNQKEKVPWVKRAPSLA